MENNYNKKIKIPGIFIVFIMVVLGGFSGLTYAVASKITVPKITLTQIGLSGLYGVFRNEIVQDHRWGKRILTNEFLYLMDECSVIL